MKNIKLIRLTSGEEILATIIDDTDGDVNFKEPIALYAVEEGKMGFMQWMPYTTVKDGVTISKSKIMFMADPVDDVLNQYKEATGGIVVPPKQGLIV
jgi:hypothetical protein